MTTHAPLRSRRTKAESVCDAQVLSAGDSPPSPLKDTRLLAVAFRVKAPVTRRPPHDPDERNARIRFLGRHQRAPVTNQTGNTRLAHHCADPGAVPCSGVSWRRLVSPASLPEVPPEQRYARRCLPSRGSLGRGSPPSPVRCAAQTPPGPSRVASLVARFPIPRLLHGVRGVPIGLMTWSKPPGHARAFGHPVPHSGM